MGEIVQFGILGSKEPKLMKEGDNKHFCYKCGKLIRAGQDYMYRGLPKPFRRETQFSYWHHPTCPNKKEGK